MGHLELQLVRRGKYFDPVDVKKILFNGKPLNDCQRIELVIDGNTRECSLTLTTYANTLDIDTKGLDVTIKTVDEFAEVRDG